MKIQENPPELDAGNPANISALFVLEMENSNLRRLVVELLEKNQRLREQLHALASRNPGKSVDIAPTPQVDPRAA